MIAYVKRKHLDIAKYDACIQNSQQSRVYAFSWYLDIVADNWDALVLDDYDAVMPIPWRRKFGLKYVYPPFWTLELGVFSVSKDLKYDPFFKILFTHFKFVESRLNCENNINNNTSFLIARQMQMLSMNLNYDDVFSNYRKDRKKDLRKALKVDLTEKWNDNPDNLIELFKDNVGKRTPFIIEKDYFVLKELLLKCIENKVGEVLSIYNKENKLVASGFFLKHKNTVTILVSSTDFKNRNNGENTFLIDSAIFKYLKNHNYFHFGGSSMESIAKYFLSFGSETQEYQQIKYNKLPLFLKLFKR